MLRRQRPARQSPVDSISSIVIDPIRRIGGYWPRPREATMSWSLKGSYVETCSCELMCPCNLSFDHGATYDYCRVTLAFNVREGDVEGTDISGRRVVMIADSPKMMTDGNWKVGVYVDDGASDAQVDKLVKVFAGQIG